MRHPTAGLQCFIASALCCLTFSACASSPARSQAAASAAASQFNALAWSDEFETADMSNWTFETGGHGWGNQERQYYTDGQNAFIQYDATAGSRVLVIEARRGAPAGASCWYGACEYSSTRMIGKGKREFQHGRVEARIRLPHTQGIWPAFWMLGSNFDRVGWPHSGEIDIMEHVGYEATLTHGALHGPGYSGNTPISGTHDLGEPADASYHVYAVEWDSEGLRWFVDGEQFYSRTRAQVEAFGPWVFDQPFFILLNVAVGGQWPGSPDASSVFPQRMYVDWVRVYQAGPRRRTGSQPLPPPSAAATPPRAAAPLPARMAPRPAAAAPEAVQRTTPRPAHHSLMRLSGVAAAVGRAQRCGTEDADSGACRDDSDERQPQTRDPL